MMSVKTIPVNDYVDSILQDRDRITSAELQVDSDFDYVMLMMVTMEYDREKSPYRMEFGEDMVKVNGYDISNLIISKK